MSVIFQSLRAVVTTAAQAVVDRVVQYKGELDAAVAQVLALFVSLSAANGAGLVGFIQAGGGAVLRTVMLKLREGPASLDDFGGVPDGVTDATAALVAANAFGKPLQRTGVFHIATATAVTVPIVDHYLQMFSATSLVTVDNSQAVRPEWFGGTDAERTLLAAHNALPAAGGVILLRAGRYKAGAFAYALPGGTPVYLSKPNVRVFGAGIPKFSANCDRLEKGTVIEGTVFAFADQLEMRDLGVDAGKFVMEALYGGDAAAALANAKDALMVTFPSQALKDASAQRYGLRLHNVRCLCHSPNVLVHALIAGEGYAGIDLTGVIEVAYGYHGIVFKGCDVNAGKLRAYMNAGNGVILKTDVQTSAVATRINIESVETTTRAPEGTVPHTPAADGTGNAGLTLNPAGGTVSFVTVGSVRDVGHATAVAALYGGPFALDNIDIGGITGDFNPLCTLNIGGVPAGGKIDRFHCGNVFGRNTPCAVLSNAGTPRIDSVHAVSATVVLEAMGTSGVIVTSVTAEQMGAGVFRIGQNARPSIGPVVRYDNGLPMYTVSAGILGVPGTAPSFVNGWSAVDGLEAMGARLAGDMVVLKGAMKPGTSNFAIQLPFFMHPPSDRRGLAQGNDGATLTAVPVKVNTNGVVSINEITGGTANVSAFLSLTGFSFQLTDG
ncbi:hypothetical protein GN316_03050 [Xylophilus sp. Kf1]|nr:hypothetical protein [Xylophilus sp. Kf1]